MAASKTIAQIKVGDSFESVTTISDEMISDFAKATGDANPIHLDDQAGAASIFGRRVAHGMLTASLFSSIFGNHFPGHGTIYLGQSLKFLRPVFPGDRITCRVEVSEVRAEKNRLKMQTVATNQKGDTVVSGEAQVMPPK